LNLPDRIEAIRADYAHCFGCGPDNPIGLGLTDFTRIDSTVTAWFEPRPGYHGFRDMLHGGIVATALDEVMAWSAILIEGVMVMTGTLELRYRKPAAVDTRFRLEGEVEERRGRRLRLRGRMLDGATAVAEASGVFLVVAELGDDS
jgi:acyl-coenzyme A thioesterase PaaI-like protein